MVKANILLSASINRTQLPPFLWSCPHHQVSDGRTLTSDIIRRRFPEALHATEDEKEICITTQQTSSLRFKIDRHCCNLQNWETIHLMKLHIIILYYFYAEKGISAEVHYRRKKIEEKNVPR